MTNKFKLLSPFSVSLPAGLVAPAGLSSDVPSPCIVQYDTSRPQSAVSLIHYLHSEFTLLNIYFGTWHHTVFLGYVGTHQLPYVHVQYCLIVATPVCHHKGKCQCSGVKDQGINIRKQVQKDPFLSLHLSSSSVGGTMYAVKLTDTVVLVSLSTVGHTNLAKTHALILTLLWNQLKKKVEKLKGMEVLISKLSKRGTNVMDRNPQTKKGSNVLLWDNAGEQPCPVYNPCPVINDLWLEGWCRRRAHQPALLWDNLHPTTIFFTMHQLTRLILHHKLGLPNPL